MSAIENVFWFGLFMEKAGFVPGVKFTNSKKVQQLSMVSTDNHGEHVEVCFSVLFYSCFVIKEQWYLCIVQPNIINIYYDIT